MRTRIPHTSELRPVEREDGWWLDDDEGPYAGPFLTRGALNEELAEWERAEREEASENEGSVDSLTDSW